MKKILISILIWVVISTVFVSCNQDEMLNVPDNINQTDNTPSPIYDKFVYRLEHDKLGINNIGMPLKVNLTTGNTTTACIDPLCMHDSPDCPFYDCMGSMIDGEVIFFQRGQMLRGENGYTGTEKLCTYHIATGQIHVLEEYSAEVNCGTKEELLHSIISFTSQVVKENNKRNIPKKNYLYFRVGESISLSPMRIC